MHPLSREPSELALAFVNTAPTGRAPDAIANVEGLSRWLTGAGVIQAESPTPLSSPALARTVLSEAHSLRFAIRELLRSRAASAPPAPQFVYAINRVLRAAPTTKSLEVVDSSLELRTVRTGGGSVGVLVPPAEAAARLLTRVDPARLRLCAAEDCTRWFFDTSKGGRRRWCSMSKCGNRAKATRHRRRRAHTA